MTQIKVRNLLAAAALVFAGCHQRKVVEQHDLPRVEVVNGPTVADARNWRRALVQGLEAYAAAGKDNEALYALADKAKDFVNEGPSQMARALNLRLFCQGSGGAGNPAAVAKGCFAPGGVYAERPIKGRVVCEEEGRTLRADLVGAASANRDQILEYATAYGKIFHTTQQLIECHEKAGTIFEVDALVVPGRLGRPLAFLAYRERFKTHVAPDVAEVQAVAREIETALTAP